MPTRQRCRLRMGKQSEDKEQVVQPQGGRFNHPYLTPYLTPYRVPHSLPHSLPPSIPHSRRIKQKHCLEITQHFKLQSLDKKPQKAFMARANKSIPHSHEGCVTLRIAKNSKKCCHIFGLPNQKLSK